MDPFIKICEELFSAATGEFKNLEFFYFHNCPYEGLWKDNRRRFSERTNTWDVLHKYGHDYKLIFVGDASMSPYEITHPGGSVEHFNEEAGVTWMQRLTNTYPAAAWLNPVPEKQWGYSQSVKIIREQMGVAAFNAITNGAALGDEVIASLGLSPAQLAKAVSELIKLEVDLSHLTVLPLAGLIL